MIFSMITRNQISKAIFEATGHHVGIGGSAKEGCFHFYANCPQSQKVLDRQYDTSVYVYRLNHLPIERWVQDYKEMICPIP